MSLPDSLVPEPPDNGTRDWAPWGDQRHLSFPLPNNSHALHTVIAIYSSFFFFSLPIGYCSHFSQSCLKNNILNPLGTFQSPFHTIQFNSPSHSISYTCIPSSGDDAGASDSNLLVLANDDFGNDVFGSHDPLEHFLCNFGFVAEDLELEQIDGTAQSDWEHVYQCGPVGLDGHALESPRIPAWNCFHTTSNRPRSPELDVSKQGYGRATSPSGSSAEVSELLGTSTLDLRRPLTPDSSATLSLCGVRMGFDDSTLLDSSSLGDHNLIVPDLKSCPHCPYKASAHGITCVTHLSVIENIKADHTDRTHLKEKHPSGSSCAVIQCTKPGEPGCQKVFKDERSRARHRQQSCRALSTQSFQCCCGGRVRRWANFVKGHRACAPGRRALYNCHCKAIFSDFKGLEDHYSRNHMGKKGRPPSDPSGGQRMRR